MSKNHLTYNSKTFHVQTFDENAILYGMVIYVAHGYVRVVLWGRIFKRLWSPGIDSKEWIPPAYVAWRAGTITLFPSCSLTSCTISKYLSFICTVHSSCSCTRCSKLYLDQSCQLCLLSDALAVPRWWPKLYLRVEQWSSYWPWMRGPPPNCPTCWPGCLTSQPWSAYIRPLPRLYSWPPSPPPPPDLSGKYGYLRPVYRRGRGVSSH